jgi:hypothetical protein
MMTIFLLTSPLYHSNEEFVTDFNLITGQFYETRIGVAIELAIKGVLGGNW